jgi:parallel beta-helix repeat protein
MMRASHFWALPALLSFLTISSVPADAAVVRQVPATYTTIQSAIAAAAPGDVVRVSPKPGGAPYAENVLVDKANVRLEGVNNPTLDGATLSFEVPAFPGTAFGNPGITVVAPGVTITGFTIRNYDYPRDNGLLTPAAGILVDQQATCEIKNNTLQANGTGLQIDGLFNFEILQTHKIINNTVTGSHGVGLWLRGIDGDVTIDGNTVSLNGAAGMSLDTTNGARVRNNEVLDNGHATFDIDGVAAGGIVVTSAGTGTGNPDAPASRYRNNFVRGNAGAGVYLLSSDKQVVLDNTVVNNGFGVGIESSFDVRVEGNCVRCNTNDGIFLQFFTTQCSILNNDVIANRGGGINLYQFGMEFFGFPDTVDNTLAYNTAVGNLPQDALDLSGLTVATLLNNWHDNLIGTGLPLGL